MRKLVQLFGPGIFLFFISSSVLYAQQTQSSITFRDIIPWAIAVIIFILSTFFSVLLVKKIRKSQLEAEIEFKQQKENYESLLEEQKDIKKAQLEAEIKFKEQEKYIKYLKEELKQSKKAELEAEKEFKDDKKINAARTAEYIYLAALKEELGTIDLLGSPDIESKTVKLEDAFVSLCISEAWQSDKRFEPGKEMDRYYDQHLSPEQVMTRAFKKHRLLLIIGDPGSGKTTLLKYYAVKCLDRKFRDFGFKEEVFPLYFPLRELDFNRENNEPVLLPQNLAKWSERHLLNISADQFHQWLHQRKTLVLLDGLDEISSKEQRRQVCRWVNEMCAGLMNACFVVTSRATGYRKLDGIELKTPHLRADIMDFSPEQKQIFLKKWFRAAFLSGLPPEGMEEQEWKDQQIKLADRRSNTIIEFLNRDENKAVQELAAIPMLLQIMAIIWKERDFLPQTRAALYDAALNYLLEYRDLQKDIKPVLPAKEARRVLAPTALWMQEELKRDEAPKESIHKYMQPILDTLAGQTLAPVFCGNLRDRAGLIADYDRDHYIFRHKSFREFLAALHLVKKSHREERIQKLVQCFKEDWWEESLRFFIGEADDDVFDRFMDLFFRSPVSEELNAHQQTLLQHLVKEAPQKRIDALVKSLNSGKLNSYQLRYVMDCLKTIDTNEALEAVKNADKTKMDKTSREYAGEITAEAASKNITLIEIPGQQDLEELNSFRSYIEGGVDYIKIPGGTYRFSVTNEMETVPGLYFCKYPVTNQRYRRFLSYLQGKDKEFENKLPVDMFAGKLLKFADSIKGYPGYLGKEPGQLPGEFRSYWNDDKKFNGDEQPVVGVTWYAARAYCFWLSCLDAVIIGDGRLEDIAALTQTYRLPDEREWEWAAGGNPDGSMRPYPWPGHKGEPNSKLANFDRNVGATTPVTRYPEGATPHGLMDMAGNAWEWMENYFDKDEDFMALRGGCWYDGVSSLRCSARFGYNPHFWYGYGGFRVVRSQS